MQQMIHKFAAGHAQYGENPELRALLFRLASLAKLPVHAVFVTDGPHRSKLKRGKQVKTAPLWLTVGLRNLVNAFGFGWIEVCSHGLWPYGFSCASVRPRAKQRLSLLT